MARTRRGNTSLLGRSRRPSGCGATRYLTGKDFKQPGNVDPLLPVEYPRFLPDAADNDAMNGASANRLTSTELASLIVDALLRAGLVGGRDVSRAVTVAEQEIEARKALGDY